MGVEIRINRLEIHKLRPVIAIGVRNLTGFGVHVAEFVARMTPKLVLSHMTVNVHSLCTVQRPVSNRTINSGLVACVLW